jgi:hypothetical protein
MQGRFDSTYAALGCEPDLRNMASEGQACDVLFADHSSALRVIFGEVSTLGRKILAHRHVPPPSIVIGPPKPYATDKTYKAVHHASYPDQPASHLPLHLPNLAFTSAQSIFYTFDALNFLATRVAQGSRQHPTCSLAPSDWAFLAD